MIRGTTALIAHIGYPTHSFKSPMIYNPYFEQAGVDAVVVPMGDWASVFDDVVVRLREFCSQRRARSAS